MRWLVLASCLALAACSGPEPTPTRVGQGVGFERNVGQTDPAVRFLSRDRHASVFITDAGATLRIRNGQRGLALVQSFAGASSAPRVSAVGALAGGIHSFLQRDPSGTEIPTALGATLGGLYPGVSATYFSDPGRLTLALNASTPDGLSAVVLRIDGVSGVRMEGEQSVTLSTALGAATFTLVGVTPDDPLAALRVDGQGHIRIALHGHPKGPVKATLALRYSALIGGTETNRERAWAMAVDRNGFVYVTGSSDAPDFPTTPGAFQPSISGGTNVVVFKLDPDGDTLVYSTYLGDNGNANEGLAIAVDGAGNAYVAGSASASGFPTTPGAFQTSGGAGNAFVAKLNKTGSALLYSTLLGGTDNDTALGIAVDAAGDAYVSGYTYSADFPVTPGAFQTTRRGATDAFVTKLNPTGSALVYSTLLGGSGMQREDANAITVTSAGEALVVGATDSTDFPVTPGAYQGTYGGDIEDGYYARFDAAGQLNAATYLGGPGDDEHGKLALDVDGRVWVAQVSGSTTLPVTPDALQPAPGGGDFDTYVARLSADATTLDYATYLGGEGRDQTFAAAPAPGGGVWLTGWTTSSGFPVTADALQPTKNGFGDAFVTRITSAGALGDSTFLGGSGDDQGAGIGLDKHGRVYVSGNTGSADFPLTPCALQGPLRGSSDIFVTSLGSHGADDDCEAGDGHGR